MSKHNRETTVASSVATSGERKLDLCTVDSQCRLQKADLDRGEVSIMADSPATENLVLSSQTSLGLPSQNDNHNDSSLATQPASGGESGHEDDTLIQEGKCKGTALRLHAVWNWKILAFAQILSLLVATQGATQSSLHLDCNLSAPTFTTGIVYTVLLVNVIPLYILGRRMLRSKGEVSLMRENDQPFAPYWFMKRIPLHASPWAYFGIAVLDVEANYASVMAFRFTTLTSASVFDAMAIPSAMILSRAFLKRKYGCLHLLGVAICLAGIVSSVLIDYENERKDESELAQEQNGDQVNTQDVEVAKEYPHRIRGDLLSILGGLLFGARDVLTEKTMREGESSFEYLGMIGLFGTLISFVQVLVLERDDVANFFNTSGSSCSVETGVLLMVSYVMANILRHFGTARFLLVSEAALLNLSLLTGDLWSAVFSIVGENIVPPPLFWLALFLTLCGVLVYEISPSPIVTNITSSREGQRRDQQIRRTSTGTAFQSPEGELEIPQMSRPHDGRLSGML